MSPTPSSATPPEGSNAYRVVRKRNRVPLSCKPCRTRKLKCDRHAPCSNCVRRHDAPACSYEASTPTSASSSLGHGQRARKHSGGGGGSPDEMQNRIDRLEGLVLSLMNANGTSSGDSTGDSSGGKRLDSDEGGMMEEEEEEAEEATVEEEVEDVRNALGFMKVHGGKSYYRGETHWMALLSEITEVKKFFEETKQKYETELAAMKCDSRQGKLEATGFPFSAARPPSRADILRLVPRHEIVELLVDAYFRNYDPIFHLLHRPTFYRQYEDYRKDPNKVGILWLGLLFIIMSIALRVYHFSGEEPPELAGKTLEMSRGFRAATEQCLIVGEYQKKPYLHTVQTLVVLCASRGKEESDEVWMFLAMTIRIAMSMGLHRDPRAFPAIKPGEAEMRRRVWTQLVCMDLLLSTQMGLPSMIRSEECDAGLPLNLHDDEITDDASPLPPERGKEEMTGVSYMITKTSIAHIHWAVVRQINNVGPRPPYEEILKLEAQIDAAYAQIPAFLRLRPIAASASDPAWLIVQRFAIELLFQKALVMLHRPFSAQSAKNPRYLHSRTRCVNAALRALECQREIAQSAETTLRPSRWFIESLGAHDFLHAAMIVCVHLSMTAAGPAVWASPPAAAERRGMYTALEGFVAINRASRDDNLDAKKSFYIASMMLWKLAEQDGYPFRDSALYASILADGAAFGAGGGCEASPAPAPKAELNLVADAAPVPPPPPPVPAPPTPNTAFAALFEGVGSPAGGVGAFGLGRQLFSPPPSAQNPFSPAAAGIVEWDEWDEFMQGISLDGTAAPGTGGPGGWGLPVGGFGEVGEERKV
ncbi:fungal-specific transcription factor domain-containing protein [Geopyxis carbonaria]|nr:fungal-specific transcription factor domain-containing protein [Geopyxis carbonaria]